MNSSIKDPKYWRKAAKGNADTISKVLWAGLLMTIGVILLRMMGEATFDVFGAAIPVDWAWIPLAVFTIFHAVFAAEFLRSARRYWELSTAPGYADLFKDITAEGGLFMRGMTPRIL